MTAFEDRQRQAAYSLNRSSFSHEPPGFNRASRRLDQIEQAQAQAFHMERIRQSSADMADLIEHARQGEFRESEG
jgi:hypothetical protein